MSVTRAPGTVQHKDEYKARFDDLVDEFVNWAGEQGINVTATVIRDEIDKVLVETVAVSAAEGIASFVSQTLLSMVFLVQYTRTLSSQKQLHHITFHPTPMYTQIFILFARSTSVGPAVVNTVPPTILSALRRKAQLKVKRYILVKTLISLATGRRVVCVV